MQVYCLYYVNAGVEHELGFYVADRCDLHIEEDKAAAENFLRNTIGEEAVQKWNYFGPKVRTESQAA